MKDLFVSLVWIVVFVGLCSAEETVIKQWTKQFGTSLDDRGWDVAVDGSGNIYVTGYTEGGLDGNTNADKEDTFLVKYNSSGIKEWTEQFGTSSGDIGIDVAVDGSGNIHITGWTLGGLDGNTNAGDCDIFLVKYNSSGIKEWTKQLGTSSVDIGIGVAVDGSGNIHITGYTKGGLDGNTNAGERDIFLVKYNSSGIKQWTKQLGTSSDDCGEGVAVDGSGNIYVTGYTEGGLDGNTNAGERDIFLVKYNSSGIKQWTKQLGTSSYDSGWDVAVDGSGNIHITGGTGGGLDGNTNAGDCDIFLVKYNSSGIKQWTKQFGTSSVDYGEGVAVDGSGNIYVTGRTEGGLDGNTNTDYCDIFLVKYNSSGIKEWTKQFGTSSYDYGEGVAVDGSGNIYVTGRTEGGLDGNINAGNDDIFLIKWADQQEVMKSAERKDTERKRKEAERKAAERKDTERKEAEREKAEREEAERKEAERKEAERKEAEREAAERKEAERRRSEKKIIGSVIIGAFFLILLTIGLFLLRRKKTVIPAKKPSHIPAPEPEPGMKHLQPTIQEPAKYTHIPLSETTVKTEFLIANKYELIREIGRGGMGIVYEAIDRSLDKKVAIKKMRDEIKISFREKERFIKEARTVARLHHPYIVDIYQVLEENGDIYLIFEYIDGKTVERVLDAKGKIDIKETLDIINYVLQALGYAHNNNVIHRDLKPSNIMVVAQPSVPERSEGTSGWVKVMDFGIAREAKNTISRVSGDKDTSGTLAYMSPEQELGTSCRESDIYSLGVCLYEMLTGELPFNGPNFLAQKERMVYRPATELVPELPKQIDEIITKCLQADKNNRYSSVIELQSDLQNLKI